MLLLVASSMLLGSMMLIPSRMSASLFDSRLLGCLNVSSLCLMLTLILLLTGNAARSTLGRLLLAPFDTFACCADDAACVEDDVLLVRMLTRFDTHL